MPDNDIIQQALDSFLAAPPEMDPDELVLEDDAPMNKAQAFKQMRSAERLLKARKARNHIIDFTELMMPDPAEPENPNASRYDAQYFHRAIGAALEQVEQKKLKRLILTVPPRHGKSQLTSRMFPAWFLGRNPYMSLMFATYNEPFAEDFGREVRAMVESDPFRLVFPEFSLRKGGASASRLQTDKGGLAAFVGRGGSITGRGADVLIIDDPIKDHKEAASGAIRNDLWTWFNDTAMTRLMTDDSCVIIIMTRWHEDDLIGRLTNKDNPCYSAKEAKQWKIINIPALAEEDDVLGRKIGDALWPTRFGRDYLLSVKNRSPRSFSALYQQRPSPEDGDFFTRGMIKTYVPSELPKNLRIYASSDHAVTVKQENDFTCLLIVGVDEYDNIWVLDCWWQKAKTDRVVEAMIDKMEQWQPLVWWAGNDQISRAIGPFLFKRMRERKVYVNVSQSTERGGDKMQKAQAIQGRMAMGCVLFPVQASWFQKAQDELLKFPNAKFDDFVDALAHIGKGLAKMLRAPRHKEDTPSGPAFGTFGWVKAGHVKAKRFKTMNEVLRNG